MDLQRRLVGRSDAGGSHLIPPFFACSDKILSYGAACSNLKKNCRSFFAIRRNGYGLPIHAAKSGAVNITINALYRSLNSIFSVG